jgi:Mn2+/Fe2+ NRAMP family transporter
LGPGLVTANVINIGADIGALGASAGLIIHIPPAALMVIFTLLILTLEITVSYRRYAKVLKWLTVSLLAYPITAFFVPEPWGTILRATFVPHIQFSATFFYVITAVIGTTITPYMFFWQASQEVEENRGRPAKRSLRDLRTDSAVAMIISQAVAWFIIITAATVLHTARGRLGRGHGHLVLQGLRRSRCRRCLANPMAARGWPARSGWTATRCAGPATGPRPGSGSGCSPSS